MGAYNGNPKTFYPNFTVNLPGSGADTVWHLDWATWNTTTGVGNLYASTSTAPTGVSFTGTNAGGGGFDQLRLFSRSGGSEVQSGNIAFEEPRNAFTKWILHISKTHAFLQEKCDNINAKNELSNAKCDLQNVVLLFWMLTTLN
jgi:hypothetical protein